MRAEAKNTRNNTIYLGMFAFVMWLVISLSSPLRFSQTLVFVTVIQTVNSPFLFQQGRENRRAVHSKRDTSQPSSIFTSLVGVMHFRPEWHGFQSNIFGYYYGGSLYY